MASHHRVMLFCLTLFVFAPALYALGEWLAGALWGLLPSLLAVAASYLYVRSGEREAEGPVPREAPMSPLESSTPTAPHGGRRPRTRKAA